MAQLPVRDLNSRKPSNVLVSPVTGLDYAKAREKLNMIPTLMKENEDDDQFRKEAKELLDQIKDK